MKLHYRETGRGFPVVVLHGLLGAGDNWLSTARSLKNGLRLILPDLRNHGGSPWSGPFGYSDLAADVIGLADTMELDIFSIVGHSMGGKAAMKCALRSPARIHSLVVADISPRAYGAELVPTIAAMRTLDLARLESRKAADEALARAGVAEPWVRGFLLKNLVSSGEGFAWKCNLDAIAGSYDSLSGWERDDVSPYGGKTLFLRGERSRYVGDEDLTEIRRLFPRAEIATVPGAGHWLHTDNPGFVTRILEDFLS